VVSFASETVVLPKGTTEISVPVTGTGAGGTAVLATSDLGRTGASVWVSQRVSGEDVFIASQPVGISVPPVLIKFPIHIRTVGSHPILVQLLSEDAQSDISVTVSSSDPAVAAVAGSVVIPAGEQTAELTIDAGAEGSAELILRFNGAAMALSVTVGAQQPVFPGVVSPPVGISVPPMLHALPLHIWDVGSYTISMPLLNTDAPSDIPVTVSSSDSAIAAVTGSVIIPAGRRTAALNIEAGAEGSAELILTFNSQAMALSVTVGVQEPISQGVVSPPVGISVPPTGTAGTLYMAPSSTATRDIPLLSAPADTDVFADAYSRDPQVAELSTESVTILSGSRGATIDIISGDAGETFIDFYFPDDWQKSLHIIVGVPAAEETPFAGSPAVGIEVP
jgi:hypothetical protein